MATWLYNRPTLTAPRSGQKVRLGLTIPGQGGANPWLLESVEGSSYWLTVQDGAVKPAISYFGGPPFYERSTPVAEGAANPRMARESTGRLWLTYEANGDTLLTKSGDFGSTWETPAVAITGGTKPTLNFGNDGTCLCVAIVGGVLKARRQWAGQQVLGDLFTMKLWTGSALIDLAVEEDTFHLAQEWGPAARWWLHALLAGETDTARLASGDYGETWVRAEA